VSSAISAAAQVEFLAKLQRLLAEGDFQATYKYALLGALADLAVEHGADDDAPLALSVRQLGARFIEFYWRHALPYGNGRSGAVPGVLVQNKGSQAKVISCLVAFRAQTGATSASQARAHPAYADLLTQVSDTVSKQPLQFLQNFGGSTDALLYERGARNLPPETRRRLPPAPLPRANPRPGALALARLHPHEQAEPPDAGRGR
jgi:hypothetical protein